jgi:hypothetical protein
MTGHLRGQGNGAASAAPAETSDRLVAAHQNKEGDGRVDIVVVTGAGGPRLELRLLAWGRGIGWYPLRRIGLDRKQALALRRSLVRAERYLGARKADAEGSACRIIPFPVVREIAADKP